MKKLWKPVTLWLGMYIITAALFWYESGHLTTGLGFGLISATCKTAWAALHHKLVHVPIDAEGTVRI